MDSGAGHPRSQVLRKAIAIYASYEFSLLDCHATNLGGDHQSPSVPWCASPGHLLSQCLQKSCEMPTILDTDSFDLPFLLRALESGEGHHTIKCCAALAASWMIIDARA